MQQNVYTIGHSTLSFDAFAALITEHKIEVLVDVRAFPGSRRYPHFNKENLQAALPQAGIRYEHMLALGGRRRKAKADEPSANIFWQNVSFRNYADYALGGEFRDALQQLEREAAHATCAIMCSEAVWWRCHRRIITDYLLADGIPVLHIVGTGKPAQATMTEAARPAPGGGLIYDVMPGGQADLFNIER
jgi:uncharacterized protein (DUF488 family)